MVNPAWGKKRVCAGCSVRYYDLKNPSPICPKCGTAVDLQAFVKPKKRVLESISSTDIDLDNIDIEEDVDIESNLDTTALDEEVLEDEPFEDDLSKLAPLDNEDV